MPESCSTSSQKHPRNINSILCTTFRLYFLFYVKTCSTNAIWFDGAIVWNNVVLKKAFKRSPCLFLPSYRNLLEVRYRTMECEQPSLIVTAQVFRGRMTVFVFQVNVLMHVSRVWNHKHERFGAFLYQDTKCRLWVDMIQDGTCLADVSLLRALCSSGTALLTWKPGKN